MSFVPQNPAVVSDEFLTNLVTEFETSETVGIILTGSHARGDAAPSSDVDITRFVTDIKNNGFGKGTALIRGERLVSINDTTIERVRNEMKKPELAGWVVPAICQARILSDRDDAIAGLKKTAVEFSWEPLRSTCRLYAVRELAGLCEEARKLLNDAADCKPEAAAYAAMGLLLGLTRVAAVDLGVMITSENFYFSEVRTAVGENSEWSELHIAASGMKGSSSLPDRAAASLRLYLATAELLGQLGHSEEQAAIDNTVEMIKQGGQLPKVVND